jgi:ribose transport system ATP-binding protein
MTISHPTEPAAIAPTGAPAVAIKPLLEVRGVSKAFGATQALDNASIDIRAGEVHVLLGENGAGKSTLAKIIAGVHQADSGEIRIGGDAIAPKAARDARALGISIIFQDLSLAPHLTAVENLFLGTEAAGHPFQILPRARERQRARAVLQDLAIDIPLDVIVANLSIGKKQLLEIAKALLQAPRLLIADEPTSALTEHEKAFLFEMIRQLTAKGTAILYVTHHLREVLEIGSRVSTMRDGRVTGTVAVDDSLDERRLVEMLTGRRPDAGLRRSTPTAAGTVLEIAGLDTADGCRGVDLTVRKGEVVGIYGVVGSGREALARVLVGMEPATGGRMQLAGQTYRPGSPAQAAALGVGYLAMDRKTHGNLPHRSIRENLTLGSIGRQSRFGFIRRRDEHHDTRQRLRSQRVRYASMEDLITSLSGGNQQKVLFARALGRQPRLLVMEDPTAGIDVGAKRDIHESIRALAGEGFSFVLMSSDLSETLTLCDRIYTIYRGRLTDEIHNPSLDDEERILAGVLRHAGGATSELIES